MNEESLSARIPVTVLTGYLGAGKTTLLNRILSEDHGRRYAVIVNEFGDVGIDSDLIVKTDEELFEMNNGCICCTVRGDLIRSMHALLSRGTSDGRGFDAIIVETTGLADPGPVVQTFFIDHFLQARTVLDSVTTVVDAKHVLLRLADSREAAEQIAFADQIVLNKTELVGTAMLHDVVARLRSLNPTAPIHPAQRANVALDKVLARGGFDIERITSLEPSFLGPLAADSEHPRANARAGESGHANALPDHAHDAEIRSVSLSSEREMDRVKVTEWLTRLAADQGEFILRAKGILAVDDDDRRLVFQMVQRLFEIEPQQAWKAAEPRTSRAVFIGRNLDIEALRAAFESCVAAERDTLIFEETSPVGNRSAS